MSDVTVHTGDKSLPDRTETGWAQARHLRGKGMRTCRPAVLDRTGAEAQGTPAEDNIVRGED
ncbi:hypothetical protein AB0N17_14445 [Streptomyces sp. NPDC051133]|uniref:hypothetical protein n=1 Tax=Streptomyces sp. NPDC051133 TaxID=3155521 RepID=UPI003440898A